MTVIDQVLTFARSQIGKPYVFGATGPNAYDCSGLAQAAYKSAGISISRTTYTQILDGIASVTQDQLQPGDLVFPDPGHVQIYSGSGNVIEAPHSGANVREVSMWGFWRARRIVNSDAVGTTNDPNATTAGFGIPNPLGGIQDLWDAFQAANKLFGHLTDPKWWARIGIGVLAVAVIVVAFVVAFSGTDQFKQSVQEVTKITKVAAK